MIYQKMTKNNKNASKNSFSQKESNKNLDSESEELNSNLSKNLAPIILEKNTQLKKINLPTLPKKS